MAGGAGSKFWRARRRVDQVHKHFEEGGREEGGERGDRYTDIQKNLGGRGRVGGYDDGTCDVITGKQEVLTSYRDFESNKD